MQNSYILKNKNNELLCFYYGEQKAIYYKKYQSGSWLNPVKVIENISSNFTIDFYKNGHIYLFCQSLNGDVILAKEEGDFFKTRIIFKSENERNIKSLFYALLNENGMTVLYNSKQDLTKINVLNKKTIGYQQKWSDEEIIDSFVPFNLSLFKVQKIQDDHLIILYKKRENILGYREINQTKFTSFNIFCKTSYQIIDQTFLATDSELHFLYIIKNMFSNQVIYRKRDQNGFGSPIVLYEGHKIKTCSLAIFKNELYAFWTISNALFYAKSNNNGISFAPYSKYSTAIPNNIKKVDFISFNKMQPSDFVLNEVYVDTNNLTDIQFFKQEFNSMFNPILNNSSDNISHVDKENFQLQNFSINQDKILHDDFMSNFNQNFDNFFNKNTNKLNTVNSNLNNVKNTKSENIIQEFKNLNGFEQFNTPPDKKSIQNQNLSGIKVQTELSSLQTKLNNAQNQIEQKDRQILDLNNTIKQKNILEKSLKQEIQFLKQENQKILQEQQNNIEQNQNLQQNQYLIEKNLDIPTHNQSTFQELSFKEDTFHGIYEEHRIEEFINEEKKL